MNQPAPRQSETNANSTGPAIRFPAGGAASGESTTATTNKAAGQGATRAEQVFLSPRVIDSESFDDLASELRNMIQQSSTLLESLSTQTKEAKGVADELNKAATRHQERLNLGARLLRTVQDQIDRLEETAGEVERRLDRLQNYEDHAEERLNDFKRRLDTVYTETQHQLTAKETEIGANLTQMQKVVLGQAEDLRGEAVALDDRLANIHDEAAKFTQPVSLHLQSLVEQAKRIMGAETVDAEGRPTGPTPGTLTHLLASTREIQEKSDFAAHQAAVIREQCEDIRQAMGDELLRSASTLDQITERHDTLRLAVSEAASLCEVTETKLRDRIATLETQINTALTDYDQRITARTSALQQAHTGADHTLRQIISAQTELEQLVQLQAESSARVRSLLTRLAPWESILESTDENDLPAPLRKLVDSVQSEVSREFSQLGRTLSAMAQQAEQLARDPAGSAKPATSTAAPTVVSIPTPTLVVPPAVISETIPAAIPATPVIPNALADNALRIGTAPAPVAAPATPPTPTNETTAPAPPAINPIDAIITTLAARAAMKQEPPTSE